MVTKAQIAKLKEPSLKLVGLVVGEMLSICVEATGKVIQFTILQLDFSHLIDNSGVYKKTNSNRIVLV